MNKPATENIPDDIARIQKQIKAQGFLKWCGDLKMWWFADVKMG